MSTFTFSDKFLKVYTNKNSSVFSDAGKQAYKDIEGRYGVMYNDFDCDKKMINDWKGERFERFFTNSPRRLTLKMDDKIAFHNVMTESKYTPESYLTLKEISDKDAYYFVKRAGSTASRGVNIYDYESLQTANISGCVIQKNIDNPHLHNNKRYKIRQLVLLHDKNVYLHKDSWFSMSNIDYENKEGDLREKHVIYQKGDTIFELSEKLEDFDLIFKNITDAVRDFKKYYAEQVNGVPENEYSILGFDFIVDSDKNVQIIEINHRSNYAHPRSVRSVCDVGFVKDMILLMTNKTTDNTRLVLV